MNTFRRPDNLTIRIRMALQSVWNVGPDWYVNSHARNAGFGTVAGFDLAKQDEAIIGALSPKRLNRFTSRTRFEALSVDAIREVTRIGLAQPSIVSARTGGISRRSPHGKQIRNNNTDMEHDIC